MHSYSIIVIANGLLSPQYLRKSPRKEMCVPKKESGVQPTFTSRAEREKTELGRLEE